MFSGIGTGELILIIAVLVGLFGRKKTTEIARDLGEASKEFKRVGKDYESAVEELKKPVLEVVGEPVRTTESESKPAENQSHPTAQSLDHQMISSAKNETKLEGGENVAS